MRNDLTIASYARSLRFAFSHLWRAEKLLLPMSLLPRLLDAANAVAVVIFTRALFEALGAQNARRAFCAVVVFAAWELFSTFIGAVANKQLALFRLRYSQKIGQVMFEKMAIFSQEQMESSHFFEKYEIAKKALADANVISCVSSLFATGSSIVAISGIVYILRDMPAWILLLIAAAFAVNGIVNYKVASYSVAEMQEETPTERRLYYTRGRLMRIEYAKEIRAYNLSDFISKKFREFNEGYFKINEKYSKKSTFVMSVGIIVTRLQIFGIYLYSISRFMSKEWTVAAFSTTLAALLQLSSLFSSVVSEFVSIGQQSVLIEKFASFLNEKSSHTGSRNLSDAVSDEDFRIEFEDVSFKYAAATEYALKNVNLSIKRGEKLSIVGVNGAGKSTFISLLLGFYRPTSGRILLNGIDIHEFEYGEYSRLFSAVMQDYQIFAFTVLDNIYFPQEPDELENAKAVSALGKIGLTAAVERLPEKELSYLTQRFHYLGVELSGGEEQKLAIARALYRDSPIFILDEPTAALSPASEYEIYRTFSELTDGKTVLFISHRMSSCRLCDRILVFDGGELVGNGTHDDLLGTCGIYGEMYTKQASFYADAPSDIEKDGEL